MAFLIDSTAASRLTTTPRRIPRDSETPSPTTSRPSPSRISATPAVTFDVPTSRPTRYRSLRATLPPGHHVRAASPLHEPGVSNQCAVQRPPPWRPLRLA